MIDLQKLRRFEQALEKSNTSPVVTDIWNELEPQITNHIRYMEEQEGLATYWQLKYAKMIEIYKKMLDASTRQSRLLIQIGMLKHLKHGN